MKLSIVTPCFNEELAVRDCAATVAAVMRDELPGWDYEHIFSDNASTDQTVTILRALAAQDRRIKIVVNSRNVGPLRNTLSALAHTSAELVIPFVPADLQDPPEYIPRLVETLTPELDVVFGVRTDRKESLLLRIGRGTYYRLVSWLSKGRTPPPHAGDFMLVRRPIVEAVAAGQSTNPYLRGLVAQTEPRFATVEYPWGIRHHGRTKNSLASLADQAFTGLVSTAQAPLRWALPLGFLVSAFGLLYAVVATFEFATGYATAGRGMATVIVALFFLSGIQLFVLGVIGEFVLSIHSAVNPTPPATVRELVNFDAD